MRLPLASLALAFVLPVHAQTTKKTQPPPPLKQAIATIAADSDSTVAVACALPNAQLDCSLNADSHPPMQSVFKLPLAVTVLHFVEQSKLSLDQQVRFLPADRIPSGYSPLQDEHPAPNVDVSLRELFRLAVNLSDNVAADILLRVIGGPQVVQAYITSLGIKDFHIVDGEHGLYLDAQNQFHNWISPSAAVQLLRLLADASPLTPADTQLLFGLMETSPMAPHRIRDGVPPGTVVRHKGGTSQTILGLTYATNDVALITLPDGRTLALAVFLTNSTDDDKTRDATIASIAKAIYEAAIHP
ncbi:class A beta-lactamase [Granulicella sibirica]|uniref:beta-lactamase n=1 Tax=Granulicella sibirica TaxID=2479048 RepID=A0A4Q0T8J2_9BACT|nr:class A beta-lactamase [Granulicella sibirica]RXH57931.1 Beta-lactamase [Granulicella sibirica]